VTFGSDGDIHSGRPIDTRHAAIWVMESSVPRGGYSFWPYCHPGTHMAGRSLRSGRIAM
jgi:hypothetical protein